MKKSVFFLLAALLLAGSSFAAPRQTPQPLSVSQANEILEKIAGNWTVEMTNWDPDTKTFSRSTGRANISSSYLDNYVHEQYTVNQPDGSLVKGESFMRYCDEKNRFEVVQMDNSGNGVVLMVGNWYPLNNTLVFRQIEGQEDQVNKSEQGMVFRYVFLEDGTVSKMTHKLNKKKKYFLASVSHYGHPTTVSK